QVGQVIVYVVAALGGLGGLWGFWNTTWAYDFYASGYRVRRLHSQDWAYEEFGEDGMLRSINIGYRRLTDTYAPPSVIAVPTAEAWDCSTPPWAHGRREVILSRLTKWAQAGYGRPVTFVPPGSLGAAS